MLLELVTPNGKEQKQWRVTQYLRTQNYEFVSYFKTRKKKKKYREDSFTHLRNELAHAEDCNNLEHYKTLSSTVTIPLVIQLVRVINDCLTNNY